jgi:hypothetical protein
MSREPRLTSIYFPNRPAAPFAWLRPALWYNAAVAGLYARIVGIGLLLAGVAGFATDTLFAAPTTLVHNLLHVAVGGWGMLAGFRGALGGAKLFARVAAALYTVLTAAGVAAPGMLAAIGIIVGPWVNVVHLTEAVWGLWAGFLWRESAVA